MHVTLSVNLPASLASQATYLWNLPKEAIAGYDPRLSVGQVTKLPAQITTHKITFYMPVLPQNSTVSCQLDINGVKSTIAGTLTVVAPAIDSISATQKSPIILSQDTGTGEWKMTDGDPNGVVGIDFKGKINVSAQFPFTGTNCWTQILNAYILMDLRNIAGTVTNSTLFDFSGRHDNQFAYSSQILADGIENEVTDSPSDGAIKNPFDLKETKKFNATMYFMWMPNIPGAIWVPLKCFTWHYTAEADYIPNSNNVFTLGSSSYPTTQVPMDVSAQPPKGEPTWHNFYQNGQSSN